MFFQKNILVVLLWVISLSVFGREHARPNILWITIEDTSPHFIGCYGNSDARTPNIDKLASEGVRFTNAFATGAVCSSSRSTIITGMYTGQLGTGNHRSKYDIPDEIRGFPAFLKEAGYYTTNNKKKDYNIADVNDFVNDAWDESNDQAGWWGRDKDQPFFAVFNFMSSHQSRTMTNPWNWYEHFVLDKLQDDQKIGSDDFDMPPFYRDTPEMRKYISRVYNSLSYTDVQIGELLNRLQEDGLMKNTIVFFYADHGEGIPRGKNNPVALGYRVPFIVWSPEKYRHLLPWEDDSEIAELVSFVDLAPTVLSLAGIDKPEYMPGRAIMGDSREDPPGYVYASRDRIDESPGLARSVTDGRFMYTRVFKPHLPELKYQKYADVSDIVKQIRNDYEAGVLNSVQKLMLEERPRELLYDLDNDPWEINNLANNNEYEPVLLKMQKAVGDHVKAISDVHFLPESMMVNRSRGSDAYRIRENSDHNPLDRLYEAASLVGGDRRSYRQLQLLEDSDPAVRYWAALGLKVNTPEWMEREAMEKLLQDEDAPEVKIELAAMLYREYKSKMGFGVLKDMAMDDNLIIANQALQSILYIGDSASDFVDVAEMVLKKNEKRRTGLSYEVNCGAEMILYLYDGQPLVYSNFQKWINK